MSRPNIDRNMAIDNRDGCTTRSFGTPARGSRNLVDHHVGARGAPFIENLADLDRVGASANVVQRIDIEVGRGSLDDKESTSTEKCCDFDYMVAIP